MAIGDARPRPALPDREHGQQWLGAAPHLCGRFRRRSDRRGLRSGGLPAHGALLRHLHGHLARHRARGDADAAPLYGALAALLRPCRRRAVATGPVLGTDSPVRAPARTRRSAPARQPVAAGLRPGDLADAVDDGRLRHRRRRGRAACPRGRASQPARESHRVRHLRGARRPRRGRGGSRGLGRGDRPRHLDRRRGVLVAAPHRAARTRPRRPALSPHSPAPPTTGVRRRGGTGNQYQRQRISE